MKLTENFERMALPLLHCFSLSIYLIKTVSKKEIPCALLCKIDIKKSIKIQINI